MPPVFGPVSPSPMRLWSWAMGSATACVPSHSARSEHSGPEMRSSSTNDPAEAASMIAASVSPSESGTVTPLPAARPSSFTTTGRPSSRHQARASSTMVVDDDGSNRANAGPGMPRSSASWRANPFDASRLGRAAVGPKHGMPRRHTRRQHRRPSAASGPGMTRSVSSVEASPRSVASRTSCPVRRHAHAIACSRPPPPSTRTFIRWMQKECVAGRR